MDCRKLDVFYTSFPAAPNTHFMQDSMRRAWAERKKQSKPLVPRTLTTGCHVSAGSLWYVWKVKKGSASPFRHVDCYAVLQGR